VADTMEQRILQYRRSIDEWLEKTEQSAQTQEDGNAEGITRTEEQDANERERIVRDKLKEHLTQIGFFQHERLIHLIVTVTFALLEMLAILLSVIADSLFSILLPVVILILLVPYIRHYYILENEVQKMYMQYDRILRLYRMAESSGTLVPHK
jgi:hypothetical protein